jgi:hypothetical protein
MGTVSPDELARLWSQERLLPEQAIGQILQHLVTISSTLDRHYELMVQLREHVATVTPTDSTVPDKPSKSSSRKSQRKTG